MFIYLNTLIYLGIIMTKSNMAVSEQTKKKLDKLKQYPRETYEDVILRLIAKEETA